MAYIYELEPVNVDNKDHYSAWAEDYTGQHQGDPEGMWPNSNWDLDIIDAAASSTGGNPLPPEGNPWIIDDGSIALITASDGTGDVAGVNGDLDAGEYFTFTADFLDGAGALGTDGVSETYTGLVDYYYSPQANVDTTLMIFTVTVDGIEYKFAYNVGNGAPGETDSNKIAGGEITDGMTNQGHTFPAYEDRVIDCFLRGTMIETPSGEVLIESINVGDKIKTLSDGVQTVRWIGCSRLRSKSSIAPVRIKAGALGDNTPNKDLLVSPHHRMVVSGWRAELLFGETEYLVPAKNLVNDDTITVAHDLKRLEYYHILFDKHEIVMSNGTPSESYHPNQTSIENMDKAARAELLGIFPELENVGKSGYSQSVRPTLSEAEAKLL